MQPAEGITMNDNYDNVGSEYQSPADILEEWDHDRRFWHIARMYIYGWIALCLLLSLLHV